MVRNSAPVDARRQATMPGSFYASRIVAPQRKGWGVLHKQTTRQRCKSKIAESAFMLTIKPQLNLRNARKYFREHLSTGDYYSAENEITGEWFGQGAEKLGLKGSVGEKEFLRLCDGLNPATGERLTMRKNSTRQSETGQTVANRRVFYDFTLSLPKSVSVVALMQDDRILELHNRSVRQALLELEKFASTRIRKSGQDANRPTHNIVTACFRHETSRELDPHLHTHCVTFNATFDAKENRWKALQVEGMFRVQRFVENCYFHEVAKALRGLGYEIENRGRAFQIKGVPASVVQRFSKRHDQINSEVQKRLERDGWTGNLKDLKERVACEVRKRKMKESTAEGLRPSWVQQMTPDETAALTALRRVRPHAAAKADVTGVVTWADEHLFERRSVVHDYELMSAALERGRGQDLSLEDIREAIAQRNYVREKDSTKLTSREVLGWELEVVVAAHDGRYRHEALNAGHVPSSALSAEQTVAVRTILGSRDFITLFRGGAGTGKSFALKEVEQGLVAALRPVVVLAPQRQQVEDLQASGLAAETLARFIEMKRMSRNAVVIVDEAGQIGGRQLAQLVRIVRANSGRLILSGDTRQHGAVAASDALRAIEKHSGLTPAEIQAIRRQDPKRAASAQERRFIRGYRSAVKAAALGNIVESFDQLDQLGCIRECKADDRRTALAAEYMASCGRKEHVLVVTQTREEARLVNTVIREKLGNAGQLGRSAALDICHPVDLDDAQKRDQRFYEPGQYAFFLRSYGRFAKGDLCPIAAVNDRGVVLEKDGRRTTMRFSATSRITVARSEKMEIAAGDRLQLKFNGKSVEGLRLNNGELVTVQRVRKNGALVVVDHTGAHKTLASNQRLFTRGYAVTSYASQGKTVDTVIMSDAASRGATNTNQWYVSISRGRKRVVVFTSSKDDLRAGIVRLGDRELALDLKIETSAPTQTPHLDWSRQVTTTAQRSRLHQAMLNRIRPQSHGQRLSA
jgi:conjugative relaxase-like TrwC/TraI family protein